VVGLYTGVNRVNIPAGPAWTLLAAIVVLSLNGGVATAKPKHSQTRPVARRNTSRTSVERRLVPAKNDLAGAVAGLKIVEVAPKSLAARAGLKYGDVLIAYNKRPITNEEEIDEVLRFFQRQYDQTGKPLTAELSLYVNGDTTLTTVNIPIGRLGIFTREWTFAGAFVEDAIVNRNDYSSAQKYADQAAASGDYTNDQILRMRMLCLNNEVDEDNIRQVQVDELYRKYDPEKLRLFANYDLVYNKRYRAAAATLERYLKINVDVSTELNLASCYTEMNKFDEADKLLTKVLARSKASENAASEYGHSVVSDLQAKIYMGRRQYDRAEEHFQLALEHYPNDPYYTIAFLYCAAQRDIAGDKAGEFDAAYRIVSARSPITVEVMGYHIDALRAFVLVKQQRVSLARKIVDKWRDSADAKRYIPVFWRRFPDGSEIIDTWDLLMGDQSVASAGLHRLFEI